MTTDSNDFLGKGLYEIANFIYEPWKKQETRNYKTIFIGLGVLFSIDTIRIILRNFVNKQQEPINEFILSSIPYANPFTQIFNLYHFTTNKMQYVYWNLFYQKEYQKGDEDKSGVTVQTIITKPTETFISNIIRYIEHPENNSSYTISYDNEMTFDENNKPIYAITYNNIEIRFEDVMVKINTMKMLNGKMIGGNELWFTDEMVDEIYGMRTAQYYDQSGIFIAINSVAVELRYGNGIYRIEISEILHRNYTYCIDKSAMLSIAFYLLNIYSINKIKYIPVKNKRVAFAIAEIIFFYATNDVANKIIDDTKTFMMKNYNLNFDKTILYYSGLSCGNSEYFKNRNFSATNLLQTKIGKYLSDFCNGKTSAQQLYLHITTKHTKNDTIKIFDRFTSYVNSKSKIQSSNSTINIHEIKFLEKVQINQLYTQYMQQKQKLEEEKTPYNKIVELLGAEPAKILSTENITKELVVTHNGTREYSFENLFLQNNKDVELLKICTNFKKNKQRSKELGQLNKLCILLYGEAGTGKSSTINAIASEFGRDLFFTNIGNCNDDDLKNIFEYVNLKHAGGGIIVIEDIDAQTDAVLSRQIDATNGNGGIKLATLLNLLDGAGSFDESIVIITTNHPENLSQALMRDGRINAKFEMGKCDYCQIRKMFKRYIERDIDNNVLCQIKEYKFIPATIIERLKMFISNVDDESDEVIMKPFLTSVSSGNITDDESSYH